MLQFLQRWLVRLLPPDTGPGAAEEQAQAAGDGAPRFYSIAAFKPSGKALAYGAALSVVAFCVVTFVFNYGTSETLHTPFTGVATVRAADASDYPRGHAVAGDQTRSAAPSDVPDLWPEISSHFTKPAKPPGKAQNKKPAVLHRDAANDRDVTWSKPLPAPPIPDRHAAAAPASAPGQNAPQQIASVNRRPGGPFVAAAQRKPVTVPQQVLLSYTGVYVTEGAGPNILLKLDQSSRLVLEQSGQPPTALIAISESRFFAPGTTDRWIVFSHTQAGGLQIDILQQDRHLTGRRR